MPGRNAAERPPICHGMRPGRGHMAAAHALGGLPTCALDVGSLPQHGRSPEAPRLPSHLRNMKKTAAKTNRNAMAWFQRRHSRRYATEKPAKTTSVIASWITFS